MLFKLSLRNIRRSLRDYAIYFFTLIIGVSIFYVFNAIKDQSVMMELSGEIGRMMELTNGMLTGISVLVALVLGLLIVYANRFLMKRRNKEFALYMLLGMSKRDTAKLLLTETVIIGIGSLVVGIIAGIAVSQLTSALIADMFDADMSGYRFVVSGSAIRMTVFFFAVIYLVVILRSSHAVSRMKLIDLMQSGRKAERAKLRSSNVCVPVFILSVLILGADYMLVTNAKLNMLMGGALTLYIIVGIAATFMFFRSLSGLLLSVFRARKRLYHKELNSFTLRQISSRINTTSSSMSIICLLLFFTICALSSAFAIHNGLQSSVKDRCPADIEIKSQVYNYALTDPELKDVPLFDDVMDRYVSCGYDITKDIKEYVHFHSYCDRSLNTDAMMSGSNSELKKEYAFIDLETPLEIIRLGDYNNLLQLYGGEPLTLDEGEYIVLCDYAGSGRIFESILKNGTAITVFGHTLTPRFGETVDGFVELSHSHTNTGIILVPDGAVVEAGALTDYFIGNYDAETDKQRRAIEERCCADRDAVNRITHMNAEEESSDHPLESDIILNTKIELIENSIGIGAFVTFTCLYIGLIFLIACGAVLALRELSDSVDSVERYDILRKIGADEADISRSLLRQTGIFFLLPLLLAAIHSIFGMKFALNIISIFAADNIAKAIAATCAVILLIYGGYFLITYLSGKRIIDPKKR